MSQLSTYLAQNLSSMQPQDILLVRHFEKSSSIIASDIISIIDWWGQDRKFNEPIIEFLIRKEVLTNEAEFAFRLIMMGRLHNIDALKLFTHNGLELLRSQPKRISETSQQHLHEQDLKVNVKSKKNQISLEASGSQDSMGGIPRKNDNPYNEKNSSLHPTPLNIQKENQSPTEFGELPPSATPKLGSLIGDCLLTSKIEVTKNFSTFKAFHQSLNKAVAFKIFVNSSKNPNEWEEQLQKEINVLSSLKHPNIVQLLEHKVDDHIQCLVMEFVDGLSLLHLINQSGCIQPYFALKIVLESAKALGFVHKKNFIHGEISPRCIFSSKNGLIKVSCNVLAKKRNRMESGKFSAKNTVGIGMATYRAPELGLNPKTGDLRSDIYSLGATLYHALTGKIPFQGATDEEIMHNHIHQPLISTNLVNNDIPEKVSDLTDKMMAKNPNERHQNIDELTKELGLLLDELKKTGKTRFQTKDSSEKC